MRRSALSLLLALAAPMSGLAQGLSYEGSVSVSTGRYVFAERTTTFGLSTGLALKAGRATLRVSLPVWLQNSTVISASPVGIPGSGTPSGPGSGGMPSGGSSSGTVGDSSRGRGGRGGGGAGALAMSRVDVPTSSFTDYQLAIGDPLASLAVTVLQGDHGSLALTGLVKVPATDTTGYGTGEWDLGVALGSSLRLGQRTLVGLDAAWWRLGDMPGLDFRDPVSATLSANRLVGGGWGVMAYVSGSTTAIEGFDPPVSVGGGVLRLQSGAGWGVQAGVGLTETSPDLTMAVFWRVGL